MRTKLRIIAFAVSLLFASRFQGQTTEPTFPKGELSTAKNHTGDIWLSEFNVGDSTFDPGIAKQFMVPVQSWIGISIQEVRCFSSLKAQAITKERESLIQIVHKGDVIKCAPGVEH